MGRQPTGRPRGRPAKPAAAKTQETSHRRIPVPLVAPSHAEPSDGLPTPPTLGLHGMDMWMRMWKAGKEWLNVEADWLIIKQACDLYDYAERKRLQILTGEIEEYYAGHNGYLVEHPAVKSMNNAFKNMNILLASCGFTPADRARMELNDLNKNDEILAMMKRTEARKAERMEVIRNAYENSGLDLDALAKEAYQIEDNEYKEVD